ncbi:MAG TPA: hypothetical protein VGJ22_06375, partial [Anaerolineales bacterium]
SATISGEGNELSGSGTLNFDTVKVVPGCAASATFSPIGVNIKGHVSEAGLLELNFDYTPSTEYNDDITCGSVVGGDLATVDASEIIPILQSTHPGQGRSHRAYPYTCWYDGNCSLSISAQPIK